MILAIIASIVVLIVALGLLLWPVPQKLRYDSRDTLDPEPQGYFMLIDDPYEPSKAADVPAEVHEYISEKMSKRCAGM